MNRGNSGATVFHKTQDYDAFMSLLSEAKKRHPVKLFGFCLMPNFFHLVLEAAHQNALVSSCTSDSPAIQETQKRTGKAEIDRLTAELMTT